jgi:hypothetical protein
VKGIGFLDFQFAGAEHRDGIHIRGEQLIASRRITGADKTDCRAEREDENEVKKKGAANARRAAAKYVTGSLDEFASLKLRARCPPRKRHNPQ